MSSQMKLTVTQNGKKIKAVTKTVEKQDFIKSLEEFQVEANASLTKMIEELGKAIGDAKTIGDANTGHDANTVGVASTVSDASTVGDDNTVEDDDENTDDSDECSQDSTNGLSESKKKKHH